MPLTSRHHGNNHPVTTPQKTVTAVTLAAAVGAGIYQAIQNSELRDENETLRQQIAQESDMLSRFLAVRRIEPRLLKKEL